MMSNALLATKYYPPRTNQANIITRPELIHSLEQSHAKLILVSAAAGFGKTTLVLDWMAHSDRKMAWLSLDGRDNDPLVFWRYVVKSLQLASILPGDQSATMLDAQQPPPLREFITVLINDLAPPAAPAGAADVLVLDDYQDIEHPEIHQSVNWFLEYLPPGLQVVVTTRSDPPFNLPRLRAHGDLLDVRAADLRFKPSETRELLNDRLALALQPKEVEVLANRTEGWIAGLQLAAISLRESPDRSQFVRDFAGDDRFIADFLVEEVLNLHSPRRQEFLLQTSILDEFNAELCAAVTGETQARQILHQLEMDNVFLVPLDNRREWFRYHRLFADLLNERLIERFPKDQIAESYQKASRWYQDQQLYEQAVDYARRTGDAQLVLDLLGKFSDQYFINSQLTALNNILEELPAKAINQRPKILIVSAWSLLATGYFQEVEARLSAFERLCGCRAEDILQAGSPANAGIDPQTFSGLIEVAAIRANLAINTFDLEDIFLWGQRVLPYLTDEGQPYITNPPHFLRPPVLFMLGLAHKYTGDTSRAAYYFREAVAEARSTENGHILALAGGHLAEVRILQGQLREAERICLQMLDEVQNYGPQATPFAGILEIYLGELDYERNRLEDARRHYERGLEQVRVWRHFDAIVNGYAGLIRLAVSRDDPQNAQAALEELNEFLTSHGGDYMQPAVRSLQAWLYLSQGNLHAAENWVRTSGLEQLQPVPYLVEKDFLVYIRYLIARGEYETARQHLLNLQQNVKEGGREGRMITINLLLAQTETRVGHSEEAAAALQKAALLASPENYQRTFLDEGPWLQESLEALLESGVNSVYFSYLAGLFARQELPQAVESEPADSPAGALIEPLSPREQDVLELLDKGLSNKEIADRLSISLTTVKSHNSSIYQKLNVDNRTRAVVRARELNLLPS